MEFDRSRVYTALNADELKPGSKVIAANNIDSLKCKVHNGDEIIKVSEILEASYERRFQLDCKGAYPFVCLVTLKWTDLKLGDIVRCISNKNLVYMVTAIDGDTVDNKTHIMLGGDWIDDDNLCGYEKVE